MSFLWTKFPSWLYLVTLLAAIAVIGVACGEDATPASEPTQPVMAPTAVMAPTQVMAPTPTPVDVAAISSDLQKSVSEAIAGIEFPETLSEGEMQQAIGDAIAAIEFPETLSEADIQQLVEAAVMEATADAPEPLSQAEIAAIVRGAIPTPAPTSTPIAMMVPVPPPPPEYVARGKYGGTPPWAITNDPGDLDLHSGASLQTSAVVALPRYSQLVEFDPIGWNSIIGDLAIDWKVSEDGINYTFYLHPDANWHDGMPVTAKDIVFSLDRIVDPDELRPQAGGAIRPFYEHGTASVVDDKTVNVPLKFPSAAFMPYLAFPLVAMYPEHIAGTLTQQEVSCCYDPMVGSGPWIMKEFRRGISIEWEKNPNYFKDGLPFWDGFTMFHIGEPNRMIASLQTEQVMGWATIFSGGPSQRDYEQLERDTNGQIVPLALPAWGGWGLLMNHNKPPFDNPNVRKAVALVLDRVEILKSVWDGVGQQGQPLPGITPLKQSRTEWPGWRYVDSNGDLITEDPVQVVGAQKHPEDIAEAIRLIDEAGARGFKGTMLEYNIPRWVDMVRVISQQLETHFDWDLELEIVDLNVVIEEARAGNYDLYSDGSLIHVNDPGSIIPEWYQRGGGRNYQEWSHPKIDRLYDEQFKAPTEAARLAILKEMETALREEVSPHWITIMWAQALGAMNVKIRNFHMPGPNDAGLSGTAIVAATEHMWFDPDAQPGQGLGE